MLFNARVVGFFLALTASVTTTACLSLFSALSQSELIWSAFILFSSTFLLVYVTLEFIIFREINKIYSVLEKIKKKEGGGKHKELKAPAVGKKKKIHEELYGFVTKKQQEVDELKKLEVFRREFLADISHELKTPIFAAQGFIHTLLDGAMDDKNVRQKFLQKAAKSMDGLQTLVEHLLTLSQLETGEIKMHFEDFDIQNVVTEIFDQLEDKAKKRHIELKIANGAHKHVWIHADQFRIHHVMTNLIDNGIKYGNDHGKVVVDFEIDKDTLLISVRDDGPGIPPEHLSRVFERFYRIEKSRSKDGGGSGLGLAIVQQIIEAHNSKVLVTSKIGKGTSFAFRLKRAQKHDKI